MREIKKLIIIGYCIAMALAAIYVPWKIDYHTQYYSTALDQGYSFLFSPPAWGVIPTIDYGKVLLEFVAISALVGVLFVVSDKLMSQNAETTHQKVIKCPRCGTENIIPTVYSTDTRHFCHKCLSQLGLQSIWKILFASLLKGSEKERYSGVCPRERVKIYSELSSENGKVYILEGEVANCVNEVVTEILVEGELYGDNDTILNKMRCYAGNRIQRDEVRSLPLNVICKKISTHENIFLDRGSSMPFTLIFHHLSQGYTPKACNIKVISYKIVETVVLTHDLLSGMKKFNDLFDGKRR